ncbi:MAG: hypothetical protein HOY71_21435 [Nonomuraea sp.]|nr:hypothetical protein [Nonomuraea sp.]NUS11605.1 hypothetical protein [Streptomyces sp.]
MIALAYLAILAACLVTLAVTLRPRRTPAPPPPTPAAPAAELPAGIAPELRVILAAAAALAERLDTAA